MSTNHRTPKNTVIRSRFRSTTEEEPRVEDTPPPNMSERPPPLPLWRRTSRTIMQLVMIRIIESPMTIRYIPLISTSHPATSRIILGYRQFTVPAYLSKLDHVEARAADEGTVHILLRHDRRDVPGLYGPAIQDTHTRTRLGAMNRRNPAANRRAGLLGVVGSGNLTGPDRPYRLVSHHQSRHRLGRHPDQRPPQLGQRVGDLIARLPDRQRLADAEDRRQAVLQGGLQLGVHQVI